MTFKKGYTQIYTGDGKGKTTAALGLALRAAGAGLAVLHRPVHQIRRLYGEIKALARFADRIKVEQFGRGRFIKGKPSPEDRGRRPKGAESHPQRPDLRSITRW
jgi:cob(I)alamin adenosyltransferase